MAHMTNSEIVNAVFSMLEGQRFADFYNGEFEKFITGDMEFEMGCTNADCEAKVKAELARLLNLP